MSSVAILTKQVALLTEIVNGMTTNAKKIDELPAQINLNPNSFLHASLYGTSQKVSVQQIITDVLNFKYNRLISIAGPITVSGNDITIPAAVWAMENVNYQTFINTVINTPYASTGYTRTDIIVGNKSNQIIRVTGPETVGVSPAPNTPIDTVLITTVSVTDATIADPTPPVIGDINWGNITGSIVNQTDLQNALNLKANDNTVLHKTGNETKEGYLTLSYAYGGSPSGIILSNGQVTPKSSYSLDVRVVNAGGGIKIDQLDTNGGSLFSIRNQGVETFEITKLGGILSSGTASFVGTVSGATPTLANHLVTKAYADGLLVGLWNDRGNYNPNTNSNAYPSTGGSGTSGTIIKGNAWMISGLGTGVTAAIGSKTVNDGDVVRALVNTPGNTDANWAVAENNIGFTPANDANVIHTTGNETFSGLKSATNTTSSITNGFSLVNSGSSGGVIAISNSGVGWGLGTNNSSTGTGINIINGSTGKGLSIDNTVNGIGFSLSNAGSNSGMSFTNSSTGAGILGTNSGSGNGITVNNTSSGRGFRVLNSTVFGIGSEVENTAAGVGLNILNSSTGKGANVSNSSTGSGIYVQNSVAGNGIFTSNIGNGAGLFSSNSGSGIGVNINNTSTGRGLYIANSSTGGGIEVQNGSSGSVGIYVTGSAGTALRIDNTTGSNSKGIEIGNSSTSTGIPLSILNNGLPSFTVNKLGDVSAHNGLFGLGDNAVLSIDGASLRMGFVKKAGFGPVIGYGNAEPFTISESSTIDANASSTYTPRFTIANGGNVLLGTTINNLNDKIQIQGSGMFNGIRPVQINPSVGNIVTKFEVSGGFAVGSYFSDTSDVLRGGFGAYGFENNIETYFVGLFSNPLLAIEETTGNTTAKGTFASKGIKTEALSGDADAVFDAMPDSSYKVTTSNAVISAAADGFYYLESFRYASNGYGMQRATYFTGAAKGKMYVRVKDAGTWTSFVEK